jgi:hypothetical protein
LVEHDQRMNDFLTQAHAFILATVSKPLEGTTATTTTTTTETETEMEIIKREEWFELRPCESTGASMPPRVFSMEILRHGLLTLLLQAISFFVSYISSWFMQRIHLWVFEKQQMSEWWVLFVWVLIIVLQYILKHLMNSVSNKMNMSSEETQWMLAVSFDINIATMFLSLQRLSFIAIALVLHSVSHYFYLKICMNNLGVSTERMLLFSFDVLLFSHSLSFLLAVLFFSHLPVFVFIVLGVCLLLDVYLLYVSQKRAVTDLVVPITTRASVSVFTIHEFCLFWFFECLYLFTFTRVKWF